MNIATLYSKCNTSLKRATNSACLQSHVNRMKIIDELSKFFLYLEHKLQLSIYLISVDRTLGCLVLAKVAY